MTMNSATLSNLPQYRDPLTASFATGAKGSINTDDQTFNTSDILAPQPPTHWYGAVWLSWPQWLAVALLFGLTLRVDRDPPPNIAAGPLAWSPPS